LLFALVIAPISTAAPAFADLPEVLSGPKNKVPDCVTPGRLMAYIRSRNPKLDPRYDAVAAHYMRLGEALGLRWDYAFYQMIVETGALSYWRGNRSGDVKASQNNFAGLGATGKGERGESFADIETGVRAHLEHLMLYAGRPVDNPVAQRTRNVRDWGVLTSWQQTFTRPINFKDVSSRWAQSKTYASLLEQVADRFQAEVCGRPDPQPELLQEARQGAVKTAVIPPAPKVEVVEPRRPSGQELAQQAIEQAKAQGGDGRRFALGAQAPLAPAAPPPTVPVASAASLAPAAPFKVLNPVAQQAPQPSAEPPPAKLPTANPKTTGPDAKAAAAAAAAPTKGAAPEKGQARTAFAAPAGKAAVVPETATPPAANQRCRVWTASYGGQKAMIIKSVIDQVVNFTVLDVNEGSETREAEAFISAYAKNGRIAGMYGSQALALDKAFELCPEG
jgi:hypothetical protein